MTCVFYTPDNYNKKTLGTTVLSPKESLKSLRKDIGYEFNGEYFKEEQFNLIRKYEFVPNSVFILLVGPNSYHSLPIIKNGNLDRKTISLNLYQEFKSSFISLRDRKKEFKSEKKCTFPSYKKFSLKRFKYL